MQTTERLVKSLEDVNAPAFLIDNARAGVYDDFKSHLPMPIGALVNDLKRMGLNELAQRAMNGEFDGTKEEAEEWAHSDEGVEATSHIIGRR